ncbi:hypothetical protein DRW41_17195 [Neobacillus piezotolerans]|uniref:Uncharacterized protein n=1 Tax=Neobacillus piezotolerans TaxID=2259171 RepID=A0A3D8GN31_9BACI|nr:hypothetical protein [Neobacillus piezotolerans]RDU35476.1 hypothetical protein DRW41_17195 [Neobacillus piezotolerans]
MSFYKFPSVWNFKERGRGPPNKWAVRMKMEIKNVYVAGLIGKRLQELETLQSRCHTFIDILQKDLDVVKQNLKEYQAEQKELDGFLKKERR